MDDVLDEWRSAMMIMNHTNKNNQHTASSAHTKRKLPSFIPFCCFRCHEISPRHDIACKIKDLNESLDDIAVRRNNYSLIPNDGVAAAEQARPRTTISIINTEVKGRNEDNKKIVNMLLNASSSASVVPHIISIVGMGGLGKTTLAQLAYNDHSVENHFDVRIWVCVSNPFDEIKIVKAILQSLERKEVGALELEVMVQETKSKISGKKFLLVLDDVWNENRDKWKPLKETLMCGLAGSTVLVTTRKDGVPKVMGCKESNLFRLGLLSNEECWAIISSEFAMLGATMEELEQLEDIGSQIADKCKGLPLAAKALGGLLGFRVSGKEWESVLHSEMWKLGEDEAEIGGTLFGPLWFSYHDLSPAERQCLCYCACFPKDAKITKDDLIKLWMAQGYVKEAKTKDMEMVAEECFENLCARSFFQDFEFDKNSGKKEAVIMHDIVHDFVQFISKKECLCLEDINVEGLESADKAVSHLFVSMKEFPDFIFGFKKLRSLAVRQYKALDLKTLFNELTNLRSLSLVDCEIREIPSSIGKLMHLRLLDLHSNRELRELPQTMSNLCNLLILDLRYCIQLKVLPREIEKASNLRYIGSIENECMVRLTQGIGWLNDLREASFLVDGCTEVNKEESSLENLKNLRFLNTVSFDLRRNMEHMVGAKQALLNQKKQLLNLEVAFGLVEGRETEEEADRRKLHDQEVIEALQPCSNLQKLIISGYLGGKIPSWLCSLNHLRRLKLSSWKNCYYLPPLGKLPSLEILALQEMGVKSVGLEFLGIDYTSASGVAFPKLEKLWFDNKDCFTIMPCLIYVGIRHCVKLKALPEFFYQKGF